MRGFRILGEYILEIVVVTLLVAVSALSVIFFIPMIVGLTGFFKNKKDVRLFKDIFITIKDNVKILIPFSIFELLIIVFPVLNIYYFNTHLEHLNGFLLAISYVALVIGGIYFATAPTIIVNMNVNFFQLLRNGFMLLFGSLMRTILALLIVGGTIALVLLWPYGVIATFYLVPFALTKLMIENFYVLKARSLGTNVYTLKNQEQEENFIDTTDIGISPIETEENNEHK